MTILPPGPLAAFSGLLASAVERGLAVEPAVEMLACQTPVAGLRGILQRVSAALREGHPLPDAMAAAGGFPADYLAHLRAGLAAGRVQAVLRHAEAYHGLRALLRARLLRLAVYLMTGLGLAVCVTALVSFIGAQMVGSVDALYGNWHDGDLPEAAKFSRRLPLAAALLGGGFVVLVLGGAGIGAVVSRRRAGYWIPAWGRLIKSRDLALLCGVVALRLESGAGLPEALDAAVAAVPNRHFRARLRRARERVHEGARLSDALFEARFFPRSLAWAVSLGEARQDLPSILSSFADVYSAQLERDFEMLLMLMTPLGILALGNVALLASFSAIGPFFAIVKATGQLSR